MCHQNCGESKELHGFSPVAVKSVLRELTPLPFEHIAEINDPNAVPCDYYQIAVNTLAASREITEMLSFLIHGRTSIVFFLGSFSTCTEEFSVTPGSPDIKVRVVNSCL